MYMDMSGREKFSAPVGAMLQSMPDGGAPSREELGWVLGEHQRYVTGKRGNRARLRRAVLDGMNMAHRDLSDADLSGASLAGANLRGVNFSNASLYCANLSNCDLRGARLDHADLRGVSFKGADLTGAIFDFADLRALSMLHMGDKLKFQGNEHAESPYGAVDFTNAIVRDASFRNTKLDDANFTDALLEGTSFRGARLRDACFRGAVVTDVRLEDLGMTPRSLRHALTAPGEAAEARAKDLMAALRSHHEWFLSEGKSGSPAYIDGEDLRPLGRSLRGLCLAGLSARKCIAVSVDFSGCALQAAKFDGSDLRAANFAGTDLSGVSFKRTKLAHAAFHNARMQDLVLCTGQVLAFQTEGATDRTGDAPWKADTRRWHDGEAHRRAA
jgi:uncharacterized protein YjbI with pentapeptide repeats